MKNRNIPSTNPLHDVDRSYVKQDPAFHHDNQDYIHSSDGDYSSSSDDDDILRSESPIDSNDHFIDRSPSKPKQLQYVQDEPIGRIGDILSRRNVFEHQSFGKEAEISKRENAKKRSERHSKIYTEMQQEHKSIQEMSDMLSMIPNERKKDRKDIKLQQMKSIKRIQSLKQRLEHSSDDEDTDSSTDNNDPFANNNHFNELNINDMDREGVHTKQNRNRRNYNKAKIRRKGHTQSNNILNKIKRGNEGRKRKKKEKEPTLKKPSKMEAVTVNNIRKDSVCIYWRPPQHDGFDLLQRYQVQLFNTSEWKIIYDDAVDNGQKWVLDGLLSGTVYQLRVRCSNSVGFSKWSNKTEVKTLGDKVVMSRLEEIEHNKYEIKDNKEKEKIAIDKKKEERKKKKKQKRLKKKQKKDLEIAEMQQKEEEEWKKMIQEQEAKDAEFARQLQYEEMLHAEDDEEEDSVNSFDGYDQQQKIMDKIREQENKARLQREKVDVKKKKKHRKKNKNKKKMVAPQSEGDEEFQPTAGATLEDVRRENGICPVEQPLYAPNRCRYKGNNRANKVQNNDPAYQPQNRNDDNEITPGMEDADDEEGSVNSTYRKKIMNKIKEQENKALKRQKVKRKQRKNKNDNKKKVGPQRDKNEFKPTRGATLEDVRRENEMYAIQQTYFQGNSRANNNPSNIQNNATLYQPIDQLINQSIQKNNKANYKPINNPINRPNDRANNRPNNENNGPLHPSVNRPNNKPINRPNNNPINRPNNRVNTENNGPLYPSENIPNNKPIHRPNNRAINRPNPENNAPLYPSENRPNNKPINRPNNRANRQNNAPLYPSENRPNNKPINRSNNRGNNRPNTENNAPFNPSENRPNKPNNRANNRPNTDNNAPFNPSENRPNKPINRPNNRANNRPNTEINGALYPSENRKNRNKITVEIDPDDPNWEQRIRDEIAKKRQQIKSQQINHKQQNIQYNNNNMDNSSPPADAPPGVHRPKPFVPPPADPPYHPQPFVPPQADPPHHAQPNPSSYRNNDSVPPSASQYNRRGSENNCNDNYSSKPPYYGSVRGGHDRSYTSKRSNCDVRGGYRGNNRGYGNNGRGRGRGIRQKRPAPPTGPPPIAQSNHPPHQHMHGQGNQVTKPPGFNKRIKFDPDAQSSSSDSGSYSDPDDMVLTGVTPGGPVIPKKKIINGD